MLVKKGIEEFQRKRKEHIHPHKNILNTTELESKEHNAEKSTQKVKHAAFF